MTTEIAKTIACFRLGGNLSELTGQSGFKKHWRFLCAGQPYWVGA